MEISQSPKFAPPLEVLLPERWCKSKSVSGNNFPRYFASMRKEKMVSMILLESMMVAERREYLRE